MNDDKKDFNKYDDKIIDIDNVEGVDIKINPSYYLHLALINAQKSLQKDDINQGFLQFIMIVEHAETLANSANIIVTEDQEEETKKYKEKLKKESPDDGNLIINAKVANFKLGLITKQFFKSTLLTAPLSMKNEKKEVKEMPRV